MRLGIICPSEIALRRFMPALKKIPEIEFAGVAVGSCDERFGASYDAEETNRILKEEYKKAQVFIDLYGGKIFDGYETIASSEEIDALYVPLPPALHYRWAASALENKKHVLVEKPASVCMEDTKRLVDIAANYELALHENYMFMFHKQLEEIDEMIKNGEIGDVRLYRISFGFPRRAQNDFRYNKMLGGGALLDAGGYVIKYASKLLGETAKIKYARLNYIDEFDVDVYGSAAMINSQGITAQIAFGMDNHYKCELEVWGNKGCLTTDRILTAPAGFIPRAVIKKGNNSYIKELSEDDTFEKSIRYFKECISYRDKRRESYQNIMGQARLVEEFRKFAYNE